MKQEKTKILRPPFLASELSSNGKEAKKRLKNIFSESSRFCGISLLIPILAAAMLSGCVGANTVKNIGGSDSSTEIYVADADEKNTPPETASSAEITLKIENAEINAYGVGTADEITTQSAEVDFDEKIFDIEFTSNVTGTKFRIVMDEPEKIYYRNKRMSGYFTVTKDGDAIIKHCWGVIRKYTTAADENGYILDLRGGAAYVEIAETAKNTVPSNPASDSTDRTLVSYEEDSGSREVTVSGAENISDSDDKIIAVPSDRSSAIMITNGAEKFLFATITVYLEGDMRADITHYQTHIDDYDIESGTVKSEFLVTYMRGGTENGGGELYYEETFHGTMTGLNGSDGNTARLVSDNGKYDICMTLSEQ